MGLGIKELELNFATEDAQGDIASMLLNPMFLSEGDTEPTDVISYGNNALSLDGSLRVVSLKSAAKALSNVLSKQPVPLLVRYKVRISLAPVIWLPVTISVSGTARDLVNDPEADEDSETMPTEIQSVTVNTMDGEGTKEITCQHHVARVDPYPRRNTYRIGRHCQMDA